MRGPHAGAIALLACLGSGTAPGWQSGIVAVQEIRTVPERTGFRDTSRYEDVLAFLEAVDRASPRVHLTSFGTTTEQRALPLAVVGAPDATARAVRATGKLRVYIQGNIHGGEVEGKESAQMLLRRLAAGDHDDWLQRMVFLVAPIYNADGNERLALTNRGPQHGPLGGHGERANAQGLDLNRDHMKLDSPEARAFVRLLTEYDPHVTFDLHTTNGTRHAYHLTYAPPLHPGTHAGIVGLLRGVLLPRVTEEVRRKYGWETFYYGNVAGGRNGSAGAAAERRWATFDHRPRFNNNYVGLRNRVALLSEAYAYLTFRDRILATTRFVEESLHAVASNAGRIAMLAVEADREPLPGTRLPLRAALQRSGTVEILMGAVAEERHPVDGHVMHLRRDVRVPHRMADYGTFRGLEPERVPSAYYLPAGARTALDTLAAHGIQTAPLKASMTAAVEEFRIERSEAARVPFQHHRERTLTGAWTPVERRLAAGTVEVSMSQPLARLAFYLLEPRSDDGLVNWNLLDAELADASVYPVVRSRD
jgi:hypothetical protein